MPYLLIVFLMGVFLPVFAQKKPYFFIESTQKSHFKNLPQDSVLLYKKLKNIEKKLHLKGYAEAQILKFIYSKDSIFIHFHIGEKYYWQNLKQGNLPQKIAQEIGFSEKKFQQKIFSWAEIEALFQKILKYSQNNAYPFAQVNLSGIQMEGYKVNAKIEYQAQEWVRFDSLKVYGTLKIKEKFLKNYLHLSYKRAFSQEILDKAAEKLRKLEFVKFSKAPTVFFLYEKAYWHLFLERNKSNEIDGIVGFLPNPQDNSLLLTGQLRLKLDNLFASGKTLQLNWQRLRPESQLLDFSYSHPAFVGLPLDVAFALNMNKQDSSFLNLSQKIEIAYRWQKSKLAFFYHNKSSTSSDSIFRQNNEIKKIQSFEWQNYGFYWQYMSLDDIFQPRKGSFWKLSASTGNKILGRQKLLQSEFLVRGQSFFALGKNSTFLIELEGGLLESPQIFINEYYQLGGFQRLRGFNENSFFAPYYGIFTQEYRLYFGESSALFAFADYAFLDRERAVGFGAGMNLKTQSGIFRFMYALGSSQNQAFALQNSKIHLGLLARF